MGLGKGKVRNGRQASDWDRDEYRFISYGQKGQGIVTEVGKGKRVCVCVCKGDGIWQERIG